MKSVLLTVMFMLLSLKGYSATCKTNEGSDYTCGDVTQMLEVIMTDLSVDQNTAYIFSGGDKVLRHIVRYSHKGSQTDSYFQDYIYNTTRSFFHLVHFVKNADSQYDVYIEDNVRPTGSFNEDINHVSRRVDFLGTTTQVSFDKDGYPSTTLQTANDTRKLVSSKSGLSFSILESFSEVYHLVYRL